MGTDLVPLAPHFEIGGLDPLPRIPLLPEALLRRRHCREQFDTRFRACARLLQSIWREDRGLPIGHHTDPAGKRRKLGSRIASAAARTGANFLSPAVAHVVRRELAYREIGAFVDEERLLTNLLSSQPLCFNLLAPLKLDPALATRTLAAIIPGFVGEVVQVLFEHSPGRGHPLFTADHSAFDALVRYRTSTGGRGFVAIEVKYSEAMQEPVPAMRPRYDELSRTSGLFFEPDSPRLRTNPLQQLWREHLLAQSMLDQEMYEEGTFVMIAPRLNHLAQNAAGAYNCQLVEPAARHARFVSISLERVIAGIADAGARDYAATLFERYGNWRRVDGELELHGWGEREPALTSSAQLEQPRSSADVS